MTVLLKIEDVASELAVPPLGVRRLIARGVLAGVKLGETKEWRVSREELTRYVVAGALDFDHPAFDGDGRWYAEDLHNVAEKFRQAVILAADDQRLGRDGKKADIPALIKTADGQTLVRPIEISPAVATVFKKPVNLMQIPGKPEPRFPTLVEAYAVNEFRLAVRRQIQAATGQSLPRMFDHLFAGPDAYKALVSSAIGRFGQGVLSFRESIIHGDDVLNVEYVLRNVDIASSPFSAPTGKRALMERLAVIAL